VHDVLGKRSKDNAILQALRHFVSSDIFLCTGSGAAGGLTTRAAEAALPAARPTPDRPDHL
jgi:hypothetical protein